MKKVYENVKNNETGITILALVITIIVLLILAGITMNMGKQGIKESKEDAKLTELAMVQNAVLQRKTKADLTGEEYPGQKITEAGVDLDNVIGDINDNKDTGEDAVTRKDSNNEHYYLLTETNDGLNGLGITNSEDAYIVNYETGEVINYTTKLTGTGKPLYIYAKEAN